MKKLRQLTKDDCFRACVASIFELEATQLPNDHSSNFAWHDAWAAFFDSVGVKMRFRPFATYLPDGYWIATIRSFNYRGKTHAVVMKGSKFIWDPTRLDQRQRVYLNKVKMQWWFEIDDPTRLYKLENYKGKWLK